MLFFKKWRNKSKKKIRVKKHRCPAVQYDDIKVELPLLTISLTRKLDIDVPHELSVIIPRAEMKFSNTGTELIYSSITVVHSPRHPPSENPGQK